MPFGLIRVRDRRIAPSLYAPEPVDTGDWRRRPVVDGSGSYVLSNVELKHDFQSVFFIPLFADYTETVLIDQVA